MEKSIATSEKNSNDVSSSTHLEPPPERTLWFFHDSLVELDDPTTPLPPTSNTQRPPTPSRSDRENSPLGSVSRSQNNSPQPGRGRDRSSSSGPKNNIGARAASNRASSNKPEPNGIINYPVFSSSSIVGSITPNVNWIAFNPYDRKLLVDEYNNQSEEDNPIPVGYNRLYQVSIDSMEMIPIYWAPLTNPYNIHCSSWFFTSSLTPIEPSLEDAIEEAFMSIMPWTSTYLAELESALEIPEAMTKLRTPIVYFDGKYDVKVEVVFAPTYQKVVKNEEVHMKEEDTNNVVGDKSSTKENDNSNSNTNLDINSDKNIKPETSTAGAVPSLLKSYPVAYIYSEPSILSSYLSSAPTPSQLISCLISGRSPPGTLFTVQRQFSWQDWKKLKNLPDRPSDLSDYIPKTYTQLVLVFHGIGQKLTERVESFNFTYAINSFRSQVSTFTESPALSQYIKEDTNILTLPINWRRTVNFEDLKGTKKDKEGLQFSLNDITMKSIPTVRNLISDVMLDIPYYMSHHKPLLLDAAANEANRVYSLFTRYNPDFEKLGGTVNLIGHSLGSSIAVDLLSTQPTDVKNCSKDQLQNSRIFHFNVHNLFLVGSPVAFFLLLENTQLYPRKLYEKENSIDPKTTTHKYPYGCIAVKNLYNILHYSDPIAYYLAPAADRYQSSLIEPAVLPTEKSFIIPGTESSGWVNAFTSRLPFLSERTIIPKSSTTSLNESLATNEGTISNPDESEIAIEEVLSDLDQQSTESDLLTTIKPGQALELETRDFQKEAIGEERLSLLNENGQLDWIIPLTGSLESVSQYVSMLTAHSGYWDSKDFARMVAIECGRQPGPQNVIPQYQAKKKVNL